MLSSYISNDVLRVHGFVYVMYSGHTIIVRGKTREASFDVRRLGSIEEAADVASCMTPMWVYIYPIILFVGIFKLVFEILRAIG